MSPENAPSKFQNWTHRLRDYSLHAVLIIAFTVSLIIYIITCVDIYTAFKSGNSSSNIETLQETNKIFGTLVIIFGIALLFIFSKQLVNIFMKHKYINSFLIIVFSIAIPVSLSMFKIIGEPLTLIGILASVIIAPFAPQLIQSFNKENREESGIQKNVSKSSPEFIQENSPTTIQENSPISIHDNSNSSISIQNNFTTNQHVTNIVDKRSERDRATAEACKMLASKDSMSRISGVKMLVNLADSWLDDSDPTCKKDEGKCQDIIDILCAYIRSMPYGYTKKMLESGNIPKEDAEIRRLIFSEISSRCSRVGYDSVRSRGQWSDFEFDFSSAPIFYSLAELTFDDVDFSHATFYKDSSFKEAKFARNAIFEDAVFLENADFFAAKFIQSPNFDKAYISNSNFNSFFFRGATFQDTKFINSAIFEGAEFTGITSFHGSIFGYAKEGYDHKFTAHFNEVNFCGPTVFEHAKFSGIIDFSEAEFKTIHDSRYDINDLSCDPGSVSFYNALFFGKILFNLSVFDVSCEFINAKFFNDLSLRDAYFKFSPTFNNSYFSHRIKYNFKNIDPNSSSKISTNLAVITLRDGTSDSQFIPKGSCLFDTETWDKKKNTASCVSPPA